MYSSCAVFKIIWLVIVWIQRAYELFQLLAHPIACAKFLSWLQSVCFLLRLSTFEQDITFDSCTTKSSIFSANIKHHVRTVTKKMKSTKPCFMNWLFAIKLNWWDCLAGNTVQMWKRNGIEKLGLFTYVPKTKLVLYVCRDFLLMYLKQNWSCMCIGTFYLCT